MSFAVEKPLDKDKQAAFRDEARLVDEPYKLFLVAKAIRQQNALWITDYSAISEFILINNGIYIAPRECSALSRKYAFLIKRSHKPEVLLTILTAGLIVYFGKGFAGAWIYALLLSPLVINFYSAVLTNLKMLLFSPESLVPSVYPSDATLKSTAIVIASRNEPFLVAKMTFDSAMDLEFPAHRKEIIVVDNSDVSFPEYKRWKDYVESFGANGSRQVEGVRVVFIHRDGTEGFKPKNLDLAMDAVTAELLLYLDVDSTLRPDTLLRIAPMFNWDEKIGFVQLYTVPTNANGKSPLAFVQSLRNYFLRLEMVFLTHASHSLFYGHNAVWRTSLVRELGRCLEYHRGEVVVTEDLSMSFRARFSGYYGMGAWLESGEWVPESLRETEAMWLRWTVGTYQVYAKHCTQVNNLKKFSRLELLGWLQNLGYSINYGLVPFYAGIGLLLDSTLLMWMVVMSLLPEVVQAICAFFKLSLGRMKASKKLYKCYVAFFILGTFVNWVRCIGMLRYIAGVKQGWTPTGKSSEQAIPYARVIRERYGFLVFGLGCLLLSINILTSGTSGVLHGFLVSMVGIYGLNTLLCVLLLGRARMHDDLAETVKKHRIECFSDFYLNAR